MAGEGGEAVFGVRLDFQAGDLAQEASKVQAIINQIGEERTTAQGKGETYDVAEKLRGARQGILRQYQQSGGYGKEGQQAVYQMARDMLLAAEKEIQRGLKDAARQVASQGYVGPVTPGRPVTGPQPVRAGPGPGGYGGPPSGTIPPAAKEPEAVRKWRREAEAFQIPGREQLSRGEVGRQVQVYQEAARLGRKTGYDPTGQAFGDVEAKLAELKGTTQAAADSTEKLTSAQRALAQAERLGVENAAELQRTQPEFFNAQRKLYVRGAEAGISTQGLTAAEVRQQLQQHRRAQFSDIGDQGPPGFLHELLTASTLGIGGYRRFGHLAPGQLAGGAAAALPTGLITGGAFTAFYALQQGVTAAVRQAIQLDRQMANVKDTVQSLGQGSQFPKMRESLLGISDATGVAGSDVATLAQTFLGLTGNVDKATEATKSVAEYIEVTGENAQQAATEIATVMQSFQGITAEQAASAAISAARVAGRTPAEISGGVANVAPVASMLGLSANQTYGLVAAASKGSSLDAGQIGQSLSRILEGFQTNIPKLFSEGVNFTQPGDYRQDIIDLVKSLRTLAPANRIAVTESLGGPRNVQALAALGGPQAMAILQGNYTGSGALADRQKAVSETTAESFKRLSQTVETVANDILNAGLGKVLTDVARTAGLVVHGLGDLASFSGRLNKDLGGVPGKAVEVAAGLFILQRVLSGLVAGGGVVLRKAGDILKGGKPEDEAGKATTEGSIKAENVARDANAEAITAHTTALNEDTAALTKDAAAADVNAASQKGAAVAADEAAAVKRAESAGGVNLPGGGKSVLKEGEQAAGNLPGTVAKAEKGASEAEKLAKEGEKIGGAALALQGAKGLLSKGGGLLTRAGARSLPFVGEAAGATELGFGSLAGGPGLLAAGAGIGAYEGTTAILHAAFGKPKNVKPQAQLADEAKNFVKNFRQDYAQAIDELKKVATPAQRAELDKALKEKDNFDLIRIYNQLRGTTAGQRALGANPATEAQATFQPVAAAYAGAPAITTRHPFQTAQDANTAFQAGITTWAQNVFAMSAAVNLTLDPVQKFQQSIEEYNIIATHAAQVVSSATEAAQQAGGAPTAVLGATTQAFQANLGDLQKNPQAVITAGQGIVQAMSQATDYIIQNTQGAAGGAGFGANILGVNQGASISTADAQAINRARASQGLAAYQFNIQGNQATQILGPQQRQQQVSQYVGIAQANTQLQVTQAQGRQASQAEINQIQAQGDQAVLANLQNEQQILGSSVNLQPQIMAAAQKVAQDQVTQTSTDLNNIRSYAAYRSSLDFQSPIAQAQDTLAAANQGAARLGTSVAALQAKPWNSLSQDQQNILTEFASGNQQMFQALSSMTQAEIGLIQSMNQANPLQGAIQSLAQINAQITRQFGSQANLNAQAAAGNQGAIALKTQQNNQNYQIFEQQQTNIQAFWQSQSAAAQATGNAVAAAQDNLNGANAALANFRKVHPEAATMANAQYAQLVGQVSQAQGEVFNAQLQLMQAQAGAQQAKTALTGNTPAVAQQQLDEAQRELAAFKARFPSQANMGNVQFANLTKAVTEARGNLLETTISYTETQVSELVATNQMSVGQAIQKLRALQAKAKAEGNQADVLKLQADIQNYINQGNENASFNLPANLNIPTLYEVRRTEATPSGANYYGNHGTVNVSINISNQTDVQPAVNTIMQAVGGPPTSGYTLPY